MSRCTIAQQLVLAALLTVLTLPIGAAARFLGLPVLATILGVVTIAYVATIVVRSWARPGKSILIVAAAAWSVVSYLIAGSLVGFIMLLAAAIWCFRSLVSYDRASAWVFDGALICAGLWGASWALGHTGITVFALWTFLLIQALYPIGLGPRCGGVLRDEDPFLRFDQSSRAADEALRRVVAAESQ